MPPKNKTKPPPLKVSGTTDTHNKRTTRSTTKGVAISSENAVTLDGVTADGGSKPGRASKAKMKVTDNKTKHPPKQPSPNQEKTVSRGSKKVTKGRGAAPALDDMDEDEHFNEPDPMNNGEQACADSPKMRRSYAPVTVSDNEATGSSEENECNESEDVEKVAPSCQGQKRKRSTCPSEDEESAVEMNNNVADKVIPQIQGRTASSPHFPSADDANDNEIDKPKSKRTMKALQKAKTEEPKFVNSDSDDEAPVGKQHKVAAVDGNKPSVTKEDPAFDAVYKHATNELKRQICFVNAFPTPAESDNLPPAVYSHGVHSVSESGLYRREVLRKLKSGFNKQWFKCKTTLQKVQDHFGRMDEAARRNLLATNTYWYKTSAAGEADTGRPFLNGAIIDILKEEYFDGRKSLYKLYPQEFKQHLPTEDGGRGLEIPPRLVALIATFIYFALSMGGKSTQNWKYENFGRVYNSHLAELRKLAKDNPRCCHLILNLLFSKCTEDSEQELIQPSAASRNDYRGLDPENFSA